MVFSYRDRKVRKREFRSLWIQRINAAARLNGTTYSKLMNALSTKGIEMDRKVLADLAVTSAEGFAALVKSAGISA
jgi:large subunit ribosomal protein L20